MLRVSFSTADKPFRVAPTAMEIEGLYSILRMSRRLRAEKNREQAAQTFQIVGKPNRALRTIRVLDWYHVHPFERGWCIRFKILLKKTILSK